MFWNLNGRNIRPRPHRVWDNLLEYLAYLENELGVALPVGGRLTMHGSDGGLMRSTRIGFGIDDYPIHTEEDAELVKAWAKKYGFEAVTTTTDRNQVGILCEWGDTRLLFDKEGFIVPVFFQWTPHGRKDGKCMTVLLHPLCTTSEEFVRQLTYSFECASKGVDHVGKPYNKQRIYELAQANY